MDEMEPTYRVVRLDGTLVHPGDEVTNFRGETGRYEGLVRPPSPAKSGNVRVSGRDYYERVWGLAVISDENTAHEETTTLAVTRSEPAFEPVLDADGRILTPEAMVDEIEFGARMLDIWAPIGHAVPQAILAGTHPGGLPLLQKLYRAFQGAMKELWQDDDRGHDPGMAHLFQAEWDRQDVVEDEEETDAGIVDRFEEGEQE
jgi:hypothetical protein